MSNPNDMPGGGDDGGRGEKAKQLEKYVSKGRVNPEDYRGHPDFPNRMIDRDNQKLQEKIKEDERRERQRTNNESASDDYARRWMEPMLTYIMNRSNFTSKAHRSFAHLASLFDDKCRATDIVFGIEHIDRKTSVSELMTFSIDVTTSTDINKAEEKFVNSSVSHFGALPWGADVHYCYDIANDERYSEGAAPHFVLGLSPASIDKALDNFELSEGKIMRKKDLDTDFKIYSELYEQIKMQLKMIKADGSNAADKRRDFLQALGGDARMKILYILKEKDEDGRPVENEEEFIDRYSKEINKARTEDDVYRNIIYETTRMPQLWQKIGKIGLG